MAASHNPSQKVSLSVLILGRGMGGALYERAPTNFKKVGDTFYIDKEEKI